MNAKLASLLFAAALTAQLAFAQTAAPIVVPAATAPTAISAPQNPAATAANNDALSVAVKALQDLKRANDEILKKQAATLLRLDEIQKDAEQMKIYTKRG